MLHPDPVGTIIQYRDEIEHYMPGAPYLTWLDNTLLAVGMNISSQIAYRLRFTEVLIHGSSPGTTAPTPQEMATAPYVNQRERLQNETPRAVQWFQNVSPTAKDCGWTVNEWTDYHQEQEQRQIPDSSSSVSASVNACERRNMMEVASEMIDADTHTLMEQRAKNHTRNGSSVGISSTTTSQLPFSGKRKHWEVFKLKDAEAMVKTAREVFKLGDDQDMRASHIPSSNRQTAPSKPGIGHDDDMIDVITRPGLKRINGDAAMEFGGITIASEGSDDESTSGSDDSDDDMVLNRGDMTPE